MRPGHEKHFNSTDYRWKLPKDTLRHYVGGDADE